MADEPGIVLPADLCKVLLVGPSFDDLYGPRAVLVRIAEDALYEIAMSLVCRCKADGNTWDAG